MEFKCCAENSKDAGNIAETFAFLRSIADKNRLKILCLLRQGPKCVCEIVPALGISDKLVSHHLKKLKSVGLLLEKREGNFIHYSIDKKVLKEHKKIFNQIIN